jgi:pyrimidine-nucleoside phosphorylase
LEDRIDYGVGLYIHAKLGDAVKAGDALVTAYYNDEAKREELSARLQAAYQIEEAAPQMPSLVKATI